MKTKWISVEFKLPENTDQVLTYSLTFDRIEIGRFENNEWQTNTHYLLEVSHWVSLPQKPQN